MSGIPDDMREMVREGFVRYGRDRYSFEQRNKSLESGKSMRDDAWTDYADLGWLALRLPEELGGLGADAAMTGSLMETVGRHLLLEPLLASAVLGTGALLRADAGLLQELAPALADGSLKLAFAHEGQPAQWHDGRISGEKVGVLHGDVADRFVVSAVDDAGAQGLYLVDAASAQVTRRPYRLVDGRGAALLKLDKAAAQALGDATALQDLLDERTVALCAEALGSTDYLVEATAEYLKVRKQFGRAIGSYQALQHRMSEMYLLCQEIRALTAAAQQSLAQPAADRARMVSGAAAYIVRAARSIGNDAVQLHGGVGVTDELAISHHFRRLMVNASLQGGHDVHFERFGRSCFEARDTEAVQA